MGKYSKMLEDQQALRKMKREAMYSGLFIGILAGLVLGAIFFGGSPC